MIFSFLFFQKSTGSDFSSGKDVEVTTYNGEIFRDTWFPAIVIKEFEDKTYLVRYLNSRSGDEAGAVKLTVDSQHIRPTPPRYLDRSYKLLEKVDVLCGMGWRSGVVNKILTEGRYNVYFKHENEAKEFNQSDVRPHVKWSNGNWVSDSKVLTLHLWEVAFVSMSCALLICAIVWKLGFLY